GTGQGRRTGQVPVMSHPIIFRPVARAEYLQAIEWYENQQPGLSADFEAAVQVILDTITSYPDRYSIAERDIREALVMRFPYSVYYRLRSGDVEVLAVFHQSRDPAEWQSRA